jgi:selenium metabolism protein YedF
MKIVDAKGLACPQPLILTRKAIGEKIGNFRVVVDDPISKKNIERYLKHEKKDYKISEEDGLIYIDVISDLSAVEEVEEAEQVNKPVYVFKFNGVAEDELGKVLTEGFLATIKEVTPLPEAIVFYHEGVYLALDDSPYLEILKELEDLGVKLFVCGTCVKFYDVVERVKIGEVSNAYDILAVMTNAHHLIYP